MKVLITGGAGFIAGHTIEHALENGHEVITNIRGEAPDHTAGAEVFQIDSRDAAGMYSLVERVDAVINLAGILGTKHVSDSWKFYENNVKSVVHLVEACLEFDTALVQIGVGNWFEYNNYSNTKHAAVREVLKAVQHQGLKANIVRGLNAYGERQKVKNTGKIIPNFVTAALNGKPLTVYGGKDSCGLMDMIYVQDLARILVEIAEKTTGSKMLGKTVEAGSGEAHSVYDIARMVVDLAGSNSEILEVEMRAGESERSRVVAENPYPIQYTDLRQGLKRTIDWYAQN